MREDIDICIIGSGWSGLLAGKYALENGFKIVLLEKREDLGGIFNYSDDPNIVTAMKNTYMSSSTSLTEASDFPIDKDGGSFLHQAMAKDYLTKYAKHFNVINHILFNKEVISVAKNKDEWVTTCKSGETFKSKFVIVASGVHQRKRDRIKDEDKVEEILNYTGKIRHSGIVKDILPTDYKKDEVVLVYGGGETSSDVIELLEKTDAKIIWAIPNGQQFFRKTSILGQPKTNFGKFNRCGIALDEATSTAIQYITPPRKSKVGMQWVCRLTTTGSWTSYDGHGIPEWKIQAPFLHGFINKNAHVLDFVFSGRVLPKGKIVSCEGKQVKFEDGESRHVDEMILCTGYHHEWPFLPESIRKNSIKQCYKLIFNIDDPTLLFIGFARPTITSIPMLTEMQCQYAFKILSGQIALPSKSDMQRIVVEDNKENDEWFCHRRRPATLVDPFHYIYDLASLAKTNPNYFKLFFRHPTYFFKTFFSPLNTALFLLNDPKKQKQAVEQVWRRQKKEWFFMLPILVCTRIFCLDHILAFIMKIKYKNDLKSRKILKDKL